MSERKMLKMLTPQCSICDGTITAVEYNPAVPVTLLEEISSWKLEDCSDDDAIIRLRQRTVPHGYKVHTWVKGRDETRAEKLRSILVQLEFTMAIKEWDSHGVPFSQHLYVPETHPITGDMFCEMEDEGHVFKVSLYKYIQRIGICLRLGGCSDIQLERFVEALQDPQTGLTYPALAGTRKQSVEDIERLFGEPVISFMEKKQYDCEASYLQIIRNWRPTIDERGLTETQRRQYCQDLLKFILDDLMPWHNKPRPDDLSLLEVNREITGIRGFTREVLFALCANIESRENRHTFLETHGLPPAHPRSSTTDDIECFFSVLCDAIGKDFTVKQIFYGWRKACVEFAKRSDPSLPFYYFSSTDCFYEGSMPSFNEAPEKQRTLRRAPRREQPGANVGRRITMASRGTGSVRATIHNVPVDLPPPPGSGQSDHTYGSNGP